MADLNTKYLDYTGLGIFLSKLKEYIENRISEINGTNLNLRASGEDNPTLTSQIEDLWAAIGSADGSEGSIIENIEKILGEYVKSISTPTTQSQPLKLVITEGTEDDEGRFTIELQDNGLNDTLSTLTSARVSKITPANDGGAVTLSVDNNTGDVKITVNSKALTERIETLESRSGKYNGGGISSGYLLAGTSASFSDWACISASRLRCEQTSVSFAIGVTSGDLEIGTACCGGIYLGTGLHNNASITIAPDSNIGGISIGTTGISIGSGMIDMNSSRTIIGASPIDGTIQIGGHNESIYLNGADIRLTGNSVEIASNSGGVIIEGVIIGTGDSHGWDSSTCIKGNLMGIAENSLSLDGHSSDYFATASSHTTLKERVDSLESDRIKSVAEGESTENYLTLDVSTTNLNTTITIDDTSLKEKIDEMDAEMDTFAKSESIPTKLPNPEPLEVVWINDKNQEQTITYDGSEANVVDLTDGVYYATTSTTATRVSNKLVIIDKTGTNREYNGGVMQMIDSIKYAGNADKLGDHLPSYYAKQSDLNSTNETVQNIQDSYIKDIKTSNSNTGTKYVTITPTTATKNNVTITIDDTATREQFESIDNYTINGKKISTSPTLTGDDITLGKSVGDNTNYPTTMDIPEAIQKLRETIAGLGKVVNLSGVYEKWEDYTGEPNNGDFVIVGQKEYVYWDKWIELGDTTQLTQYLNELIDKYNTHTHTFSVSGSVESSFTGTAESHGHTFTGDSVETSNNTLSISYSAGKLTINTSHKHTVTPTGTISNTSLTPKGTITSSFSGSGVSSETNSTQPLPPIEPGAPDSIGGGNDSIDYHSEYFTIEALEDGLTVKLSQNACDYRIDDGSWNSLTANTATPSINKGQKISFKITNPTIELDYGIGTFTVNKAFNVEGNIMSLHYGDNFEGQTDLSGKDYAFSALFINCTTLQNAENLILPAATLAEACYAGMFNSCTSLTEAPQLPATTLAYLCYGGMFNSCASLTTAPQLPATTLANGCYFGMFQLCTSLTEAPELPATTLAGYCYDNMFDDCSKLNYIKMLATDISASRCLYNWVSGVASSGTFVKHPDMTTLPSGTSGIPSSWTIIDYDGTN